MVHFQNKEMARKAFHLISEVSESLLSSRKIYDEPIKMQTKTLSLVLERKHPTDIGNKTVAVGESTVDLPPASMLLANLRTNCTFVDTQVRICFPTGLRQCIYLYIWFVLCPSVCLSACDSVSCVFGSDNK